MKKHQLLRSNKQLLKNDWNDRFRVKIFWSHRPQLPAVGRLPEVRVAGTRGQCDYDCCLFSLGRRACFADLSPFRTVLAVFVVMVWERISLDSLRRSRSGTSLAIELSCRVSFKARTRMFTESGVQSRQISCCFTFSTSYTDFSSLHIAVPRHCCSSHPCIALRGSVQINW